MAKPKNADGNATGAVNTAGYNIHHPLLAARPDVVSASHTHTAFGTPWSANVEPFRAISQESCAFVFDQALFDDEEVEVLSIDGGKRIAAAPRQQEVLHPAPNHGLLTVGRSVEESIGWFVLAERVAEVHVKAPNGRAISDEAAAAAASTLALDAVGWRMFQWLQRSARPRSIGGRLNRVPSQARVGAASRLSDADRTVRAHLVLIRK